MVRRKRLSSGSDGESGKKKRRNTSESSGGDLLQDLSVFGELTKKAGLRLKAGNKPCELVTDQAVFQRDLGNIIRTHEDFPKISEEFIEGLQQHMEDATRFHHLLMPTATAKDCDESARGGNQDSVIRLLMNIDELQPLLMNILLEKLAEYTGDEEPFIVCGEQVNMPRLIMNQFRWLDQIVNSKEVTEKMLEIVSITSLDAQREIITCIPEIVDDAEHSQVARQLRDLLLENNELTVPILDALSNLTLKTDLLEEVRASVIQTLPSVKLEDLPVVVRFLLQSVTAQDAVEVVTELRSHLDLSSGSGKQKKSKQMSQSAEVRGSEALTLDAIRSGIRFQKVIAEAWVKAIEGVPALHSHKVVDMLVLFILHATNYRKPIESLLRNKIRAGHMTQVLLQNTFTGHGQVLREYFPSILHLSEILLRSPDPSISYFACAMYKHAFGAFDTYCRQEIVGNLVTHIGSGFDAEVDLSLDILSDLVATQVDKMAPFAVFVKGVLDYLENLSVMQIRKLYDMLSTLAFLSPTDAAMIQDEMYILIRKQLSNNNPKYKRMGVIAAIMVVKSLACNHDPENRALAEEVYQQVVGLLQQVRASCNHTPEAAALFMDELTDRLREGSLDPQVEGWIGEHVISDFQDDYIVDIDKDLIGKSGVLPIDMKFGLDDETEGGIVLNLLPILTKNYEDRKRNQSGTNNERLLSAQCLPAHFRLLQICEKRQQAGSLEGIDALLGCPLYISDETMVEKMGSMSNKEKEILCESLFHQLNWFREIVNAFAAQDEPEMKAKVITRLQNITQVEGLLEQCLAAFPGYCPPLANFDLEDAPTVPQASSSSGGKKGRKPGGKGKKKKGAEKGNVRDDSDESRDSSQLEKDQADKSQLDVTQAVEEAKSEGSKVNLTQYRQFFRELDFEVFRILQTGLITHAALDTELNVKSRRKETTTLQIQPPQLEFLLSDLCAKLEHALIASVSKRRSFLKTKGNKNVGFSHLDQLGVHKVAKQAVALLPALCDHLEGASAFFQAQIASNDGVVDGPGSNSEESRLMASCFQLLLQILLSIFSWNGFVMTDNRGMFKEALSTLASRLSASGATQAGFEELLKQAYKYLENFSGTVPSFTTAVTLTKLLVALVSRWESEQLNEKIGNLSEEFLKREWCDSSGEREKGAKHNEQLQSLIKIFCSHSTDMLVAMESMAADGVTELVNVDKNGCSETYKTLTRHSFSVYYRVILCELVSFVKKLPLGRQTDTSEMREKRLLRWSMSVRIFHILVNLIKVFDARSNLGAALKYGRQFVETFLRLGMPLMDTMLRYHRDDVQSLLKNLQLSTRSLQHVVLHSKIMKDVTLTNQVPLVKRCLEAFVYRVKAMLMVNKCFEAFWLGNLKNRNLQGEEILSQTSADETASTAGEESDNESLPAEDDSDVELEGENNTVLESDNDEGVQSYSECY